MIRSPQGWFEIRNSYSRLFICDAWDTYKVWQEGEEDFARYFDDCCGSNAAEQWAKEYDETEEHNIANGAKVAVLVEKVKHNGAEPRQWRYVVSGKWKAKYKAELDRGET